MKKLTIKVFLTIFFILTAFTISLLVLSNVREYNQEYHAIESVLSRSVEFRDIPQSQIETQNNQPRQIFIDYQVYHVFINESKEVEFILSASSLTTTDEVKVNVAVQKILNKINPTQDISLLFKKYSYKVADDNHIILIDNTVQTNKLHRYMIVSLLILLFVEIVSYFIAKFLTKWITKPVIDSFEREKRFIADASHELKTPIAVIMASADAYQTDKNKKWIENIKSESDRMNKLVKDLLDLNRLENNRDFKKENVNLSHLIESALLPYESLFFENKLKFTYDIKPGINFNCNQEAIKELLSILIDNAIKYNKEKGSVKVKLYRDKNIILEVENTGDVINEEDLSKIFDRFYKVDKSRNRKSNNYGLGLSIAKQIVDLHEGKISASSSKGINIFKIEF